MKDFIADRLLVLSSWFNTWSQGCKNAAIRVLISRRRKVSACCEDGGRDVVPYRSDGGRDNVHKHTEING